MDHTISNTLLSLIGTWPLLDFVALFFAEYSGYVLIGILIAFAVRYAAWRGVLLQVVAATFLSRVVITELIRLLWQRPRPFEVFSFSPLIQKLSILPDAILALPVVSFLASSSVSSSFPSGHAAFYFAISTVVFLYARRWGVLFFTVSVLMGIARVYGGVHWTSDVIGGAFIGVVSGGLIYFVWQQVRYRRKN